MNMVEALALLKSLAELREIAEATATPDGRWQTLQDWLAANPKWRKQIDSWVKLTPEEAFDSLRDYAGEYTGMPPIVLDNLLNGEMKYRVKRAIQTLQACYRERKAEQSIMRAEISDEWVVDKSPIPSAHKSIDDYQAQLKAKKKRKRKEI